MKLKKIMLPIWALTAQLIYSQNASTHKIIIGQDTGCWVPLGDIKLYNQEFVKLDFYKDLCDTLRTLVNKTNDKMNAQKFLITNYKEQNVLKQVMIFNQDKQIHDYKLLDDQSQKKIKSLKLQRNVLAIGIVVAIIKIFVF